MFPTAEVRWFYRGALPSTLSTWFQQGPEKPVPQPPREDYYLCLTDRDSLGIKLREGKIEVKQRYQDHGIFHFNQQVAGQVEQFRKWSYTLADETEADNQSPTGDWLGVEKERWQRAYAVTGSDRVRPIPLDVRVERGCEVEIGQVTIDDEQWWTLCLEAFGPEATLRDNLLATAQTLFGGDSTPTLRADHSYGYARLIRKVCRA